MRDSQSLLDQLLASAGGRLTAGHVNAVLGSAGDERVTELAAAILARDPKAALDLVAAWVEHGLQVGELVDQLIGYWRALMLVSCGGSEVRELPVGPSQKEAVLSQAKAVSLDSILAGLDVWTATRGRMRDTGHAQVLLEMAAVRLCRMDELLSVGQLVTTLGQIGAGGIGTNAADRHSLAAISMAGPSKKNEPVLTETGANVNHTHPPESTLPLNQSTLPELVSRLNRYLAEKAPILASHLKFASSYAISGPNSLAFRFDTRYDYARAACVSEANTRRIQDGLCQLTGQVVQVRFDLVNDPEAAPEPNHPPAVSVADRKRQLMTLPLFQKAGEVLGAMIWHMDDEFNPVVPPRQSRLAAPDTDEI
jgi:DNA polymerase-3 subunit gamma/tau